MEEPEKPTKRKDQIRHDEEVAQRLQAQLQVELEEEDRLVRQREEEVNIVSWDNVQAMIDANYQMALQLQAKEQEKLSIEEKSKFETREEVSSKRAGEDLQQESTKKQKMDDVKETAEVDKDKETAKLQSLMEVIPDEEEVAIDAIPLATKPPSIVDWKILKEGKINYFQIIRADRSSKRYSTFIQMLKSFHREDLETLWKLVKAKHGSTRPEEGYERVLCGNLKTMFETHVEDIERPEHENLVFFIRNGDGGIGIEMIGVVQGQQCVRDRDVFWFIKFEIQKSEVIEKTRYSRSCDKRELRHTEN
ncbi:hypothetical protein Tco_0469101 [Tanacetum coccineum]